MRLLVPVFVQGIDQKSQHADTEDITLCQHHSRGIRA